ncbi:MAG: SH3 domain-containing protein [Victivallaceae bacterium]
MMRFSIWMAGLLLVCGATLAAEETVTAKVDRLNVRAGQSTKAAVISKLASGQKVTALRANADWVEITPAELYIARSLL